MPRSDRDERVERLRTTAHKRSAEAFAAARRAIMSLQARGEPITLKAVAAEAGVSESYLVKNAELKTQIDGLRSGGIPARPAARSDARSTATLRTQLEVVLEQASKLRAENERLRLENAKLRGALLEARRAGRRDAR